MKTGFWFRLLVIGSIIAGCLIGAAGAATLGTDWKERAPEEGPYLGVTITPDASLVYAGGSMIYRPLLGPGDPLGQHAGPGAPS